MRYFGLRDRRAPVEFWGVEEPLPRAELSAEVLISSGFFVVVDFGRVFLDMLHIFIVSIKLLIKFMKQEHRNLVAL